MLHVPFLAATGISMLYFTSFTLAFMIEDTAQALWRRPGVEKWGSRPASTITVQESRGYAVGHGVHVYDCAVLWVSGQSCTGGEEGADIKWI
ncbi:hypothetical protein ACJ73_09423 [Blastomyces percursus]|uniref:Uncharacterized protein n=1 Tax=Blastomyces percursus TaxID=1658174 RepID=A0A1J9PVS7_9EURO|nr:hypothetical protein ACJ73_09423 [Blastomyces percursus]